MVGQLRAAVSTTVRQASNFWRAGSIDRYPSAKARSFRIVSAAGGGANTLVQPGCLPTAHTQGGVHKVRRTASAQDHRRMLLGRALVAVRVIAVTVLITAGVLALLIVVPAASATGISAKKGNVLDRKDRQSTR